MRALMVGLSEGTGEVKGNTLNTRARVTMGKYLSEQGVSGARRGQSRIEAHRTRGLSGAEKHSWFTP